MTYLDTSVFPTPEPLTHATSTPPHPQVSTAALAQHARPPISRLPLDEPTMQEGAEEDAKAATPERLTVDATLGNPAVSVHPPSPFVIDFPSQHDELMAIVPTPMMHMVARRTLTVHPGGALVVWTGPSRNGKTETGKWLCRIINEQAPGSVNGFRAAMFESGGDAAECFTDPQDMKRAIRSVYHATVAKLDEGLYRSLPVEALANHTVEGLRAKNIQMVFVDEAGLLTPEGIRGLSHLQNAASLKKVRLSIILIGMDQLAHSVSAYEQVKLRVHEWCYFKPYSVEETFTMLQQLDPQFAHLSLERRSTHEMVSLLHELTRGLPGLLVPFLRRMHATQRLIDEKVLSTDLVTMTHLYTDRDKQRALDDVAPRTRGGRRGRRKQGGL